MHGLQRRKAGLGPPYDLQSIATFAWGGLKPALRGLTPIPLSTPTKESPPIGSAFGHAVFEGIGQGYPEGLEFVPFNPFALDFRRHT